MSATFLNDAPDTVVVTPDDLPYPIVEKVPVDGVVELSDRTETRVLASVTSTTEWVWADGETGTPVYENGQWTVTDASFEYDAPVPGSSSATEVTFAKTATKSFYFYTTDYDYETGQDVFVFKVGDSDGEEVRVTCKWSDDYEANIVGSIEYDGVEYVLEIPVMGDNTGTTYSGTGVLAAHVATLVTTYGPTLTLKMPNADAGHVLDMLVRIDLSEESGAPPVVFDGGSFEAVDGEMPELVKGVNLLSFTQTDGGVFDVAYKEMKPIVQGGS